MESPSIFPQDGSGSAEEDLLGGKDTGQCSPVRAPSRQPFPTVGAAVLMEGSERPAQAPQSRGLTSGFTCFFFSSECVQSLQKVRITV